VFLLLFSSLTVTDCDLVCASQHCSNSSKNGVRLFPFPISNNIKLIWLNFCRKEALSVNEIHYLCDAHFAVDAFKWNGETMDLTTDAVPTVTVYFLLKLIQTCRD
jgi:hypothetical protein